MILPPSWAVVLEVFRPVFARAGTFRMFTVLATGMVMATGRRTVVGMLAGAGMARKLSFHAACRFFSAAVWDVDRLGLAAARFLVARLLDPHAPIVVAVDDTLFKRWGRRVHHVFWTHDGSAQGKAKIGRGNRWVIAGIVVRLPFCTAPVCLPVLLRLWAGKGCDSPVRLGAVLVELIRDAFRYRNGGRSKKLPDRPVCGRLARECVLCSPQDELDAPQAAIGRLVYLLADERGVLAWRSNRRNVAGRQARPAGPHAVRRGTASSQQQRSASTTTA